jgi:peptide/nickel transport system ATP-binding protein
LLSSVPSMDPDHRTPAPPLAGDPPNPVDVPAGCSFHPRCANAEAICSARSPVLSDTGDGSVACLMYERGSGHSAAPGGASA